MDSRVASLLSAAALINRLDRFPTGSLSINCNVKDIFDYACCHYHAVVLPGLNKQEEQTFFFSIVSHLHVSA